MECTRLKRKQKARRKQRVYYSLMKKNRSNRLRVSVFKSNKNMYVQLIDDLKGITKLSASTCEKEFKEDNLFNIKTVKKLAVIFANRCKEKGIDSAIFDKGAYNFHGRVSVFAETLSQEGIKI